MQGILNEELISIGKDHMISSMAFPESMTRQRYLFCIFCAFFQYTFFYVEARAHPSAGDIEEVATFAQSAVLTVKAKSRSGKQFGSGFVISAQEGLVLTNYHVVALAKEILLFRHGDENPMQAVILYQDSKKDLALLKVEERERLPRALELTKTKGRLGQTVLAAGSPGGYDFSITVGIISAIDRKLEDVNSEISYLQVDAPMFKGSSGGPLFSLQKELLGLNSRGGADGAVAFAVPAHELLKFYSEYTQKKSQFIQGYLGLRLQPLSQELCNYFKCEEKNGVLISHVYASSAASKAGLRRGDILYRIGDVVTNAHNESELLLVTQHLKGLAANKELTVVYKREGSEHSIPLIPLSEPPCSETLIDEGAPDEFLAIPAARPCALQSSDDYILVNAIQSRLTRKLFSPGDKIVEIGLRNNNLLERFKEWSQKKAKTVFTVLRGSRPEIIVSEP